MRGFRQGNSCLTFELCLTGIPMYILLQVLIVRTIWQKEEKGTKNSYSLFINDL